MHWSILVFLVLFIITIVVIWRYNKKSGFEVYNGIPFSDPRELRNDSITVMSTDAGGEYVHGYNDNRQIIRSAVI